MTVALAKRLRLLASTLSVLGLLAAIAVGWFYWQLRASLPQLDGAAAVAGLKSPVTVARDALGIPTVHGRNRTDVARALGFLHAQERFFQMDTLRRRSAGELSEIVGSRAIAVDRAVRIHDFRKLAQTVIRSFKAEDRALLEAYAAGVNAGLGSLKAKPFEYLLLRVDPQPWLPEDSLLVSYSMCLELEDSTAEHEHTLMVMRDQLGSAAVAFFAPLMTPSDAALDGSSAPLAPMPTAKQLDVRKRSGSDTVILPPRANEINYADDFFATGPINPDAIPGSNSLALAGSRTANGAALLANDMHLDLRVPNVWYRASLEWPDHQVTGATLPGTPLVIVGSNGHVAWGFTASYADRSDLVVVQIGADRSVYLHNQQIVSIELRPERILVKGGKPVDFDVPWTAWGPVVGEDEKTRPLALHWAAHDPAATNFDLAELESATSVEAAVAIAHRSGIPSLNFLVADASGKIAWTLAGRLPQRFGYDGRFPTSWYYGDRGWRGFIPPDEIPTVIAQPGGQLWTGNNRVIGGAGFAAAGDGNYIGPARAAQLRDGLSALKKAVPADLLAIELDDRALFLARWQKLLLASLTPEAIAQKKSRGELRAWVEKWEGRASIDSVSYRLVRAWRTSVAEFALGPIFAPCVANYAPFDWRGFNFEDALWTMLQEKPEHLLDARFAHWNDLMLAAADDVVSQLERQGTPLAAASWGRRNTAHIQHPLASVLPDWLNGWLTLPADPLPGDVNMPRVQRPTFGASERLVVSPGHEEEGIFHMPGGQSGHPLSPFFRAGHNAWVHGEATPFLPGKTEHTLTLQP